MAECGCKERKCPCRMWVNCLRYVDARRREWRLKKKEYNFQLWYSDYFRNEVKMEDMSVNG